MLNFGGVQKSLGLRACGTSKRSRWVFLVHFGSLVFFSAGQRKNPGKNEELRKEARQEIHRIFRKIWCTLKRSCESCKKCKKFTEESGGQKRYAKVLSFIGDAWYITTLRVVEWNRKPIPLRPTQPLTTSKNANTSPPQPTPVPKKHQRSSCGVHTIAPNTVTVVPIRIQ